MRLVPRGGELGPRPEKMGPGWAGQKGRAGGRGEKAGDLEGWTGVGSPLPEGWGRPARGTGTCTRRRGLAGRGRLFIYLGLGAGTGSS